ncbi:MAG: TetR/AcrR family transcriptional regulator [Actinomycetota bacterium]|nr:TetR/AcrR family transcriptional regulator [Actinomycetota bacterium]
MPQPPRDSRQRVLDIALSLFGERGYGGTALQAVADELGLTKASVYYHFHAKGELLEALAEPCLERLAAVVSAPPDTSKLANCRVLLDAYLATLAECGSVVALLMRDLTAATLPAAIRCRALRARLRDLLARAGSPSAGPVQATCCLGAVESAVFGFPPADTAANRVTILDAAMRALAGGQERT